MEISHFGEKVLIPLPYLFLMQTIIEDVIELSNVPSSLCKEMKGIETKDGRCVVRILIDEKNPKVAKLLGIKEKEGLS